MKFLEKAKRAHRGELGLGETFWLWFWLPLVATRLAIVLLGFAALWLMNLDPSLWLYYGLLALLFLLMAAQFVYFGMGVWLSAQNAASRFWRFVARAWVVLGAIGIVASALQFFLPSDPSDLRQMVMQLNAQLPHEIEQGVVLERLNYDDNVLSYRYTLTPMAGQQVMWDVVEENAKKLLCDSWKAELDSNSIQRVDAVYATGGEERTFSVDKQDCPVKAAP